MTVELRVDGVSAPDVVAVARDDAAVALGDAARAEMERSAAVVAQRIDLKPLTVTETLNKLKDAKGRTLDELS